LKLFSNLWKYHQSPKVPELILALLICTLYFDKVFLKNNCIMVYEWVTIQTFAGKIGCGNGPQCFIAILAATAIQ
jgi:hypothetical protein